MSLGGGSECGMDGLRIGSEGTPMDVTSVMEEALLTSTIDGDSRPGGDLPTKEIPQNSGVSGVSATSNLTAKEIPQNSGVSGVSPTSKPKRVKSKGRQRMDDARHSLNVLSKLEVRDPATWSTEERCIRHKALNFLSNDNFLRPSNNFNVSGIGNIATNAGASSSNASSKRSLMNKRGRSKDEEAPQGEKKKRESEHNSPKTLTVRDVVKNHLMVCIVDRSDANGKISDPNWTSILTRMRTSILDHCISNPGAPAPRFAPNGWHRGLRVTECKDQWSLDFLMAHISTWGEAWEGAMLDVLHRDDIPLKQRARVWIPPPEISKGDLQIMLRSQNPEIRTDDLVVLFPVDNLTETGQYFMLEVGESAVASIKARKNLNMGMGLVSASLAPIMENRPVRQNAASGADKPSSQ